MGDAAISAMVTQSQIDLSLKYLNAPSIFRCQIEVRQPSLLTQARRIRPVREAGNHRR